MIVGSYCYGAWIMKGAYSMLLHILDPLDGLPLWVHHQRPTVTLGHNDSILCREGIRRETLDIPVSNSSRLGKESSKREIWCTWNMQLSNLRVYVCVCECGENNFGKIERSKSHY